MRPRDFENPRCESGRRDSQKNRFWRAAMRRKAGDHENFFIAKNRDSESAQRRLSRHRSVAPTSIACRSFVMRSAKTPAASAFLSISTTKCVAFSRVARIVVPIHWGVVDERVSPLPARARQYFLKQDAVFLDVLVYSGCSAFRFPSARSD